MNQETLNNLKIGEKVADVQEYFHGKNGKDLVYKVTIFECIEKRILYIFKTREIKEYVFPFFFKTKEFAEEFLTQCDNFNVVLNKCYIGGLLMHAYMLEPRNIAKPKNRYILINKTGNLLGDCSPINANNDVWDGFVNYAPFSLRKNYIINYKDITKIETLAAKEGTIGNTFSYKLSEI